MPQPDSPQGLKGRRLYRSAPLSDQRERAARGGIAPPMGEPPRSATLRANYHAAPRRGLPSWSACDSKRGTRAAPRSATLRALPCGAPWSLPSACAPVRAHPCGSPSVAAAAKAATDRGVGAADGGGGGFRNHYRRRAFVCGRGGARAKVWTKV